VQLDQARKRHDRRIDEADLVMVAVHEVGVAEPNATIRTLSCMKTSPRIGLTMKNAKGINRERRLFFQGRTECDFTLNSAADSYTWRAR
jgi:hypothetical protein